MSKNLLRQIAVILTTLFTLGANAAANSIPLNGRTTAEISDSFNVLFVPAGYVFAIWGVIYIGLLAYTIYQALPSQRENPLLIKTGWPAAVSSLANGAWIFFWHYGLYGLTLVAMGLLLAMLITIYLRIDNGRVRFSRVERWTVSIPFSIYLGWITVATIANVTAVLGGSGWSGWGISPVAWTVILLTAGVVIALITAMRGFDPAFLLVLVWAFAGISVRWQNMEVLNVAGYIAAGLVLALLAAGVVRRQARPS